MRTRIDAARLRIRPIWLMAAATCFIPTLLISDASQTTADARMMMERPMAGHAPRMGGGGHRMHGGGHRSHGHRGGHRSYGFSGGSAVGMGLAIGGMVIDQMQRAQARDRDYDDEPRDAPTGRHVDKPRNSTAVSKPKKQDPPSVARKKKDEPVYAKSDTLYAKKQDTPHSGRKKDEPRSGRTDEPVSRRAPPQPDPDRPDPLPQEVELELMLDQITNGGMPVRNADGSTSIITTDPKGQLVRFGPGHKNCYEANEYLKLAERAEADAADKRKQAADLKGRDFQGLKDMLEDHADRRTKDAETFRTKAAQAGACGGAHPIR